MWCRAKREKKTTDTYGCRAKIRTATTASSAFSAASQQVPRWCDRRRKHHIRYRQHNSLERHTFAEKITRRSHRFEHYLTMFSDGTHQLLSAFDPMLAMEDRMINGVRWTFAVEAHLKGLAHPVKLMIEVVMFKGWLVTWTSAPCPVRRSTYQRLIECTYVALIVLNRISKHVNTESYLNKINNNYEKNFLELSYCQVDLMFIIIVINYTFTNLCIKIFTFLTNFLALIQILISKLGRIYVIIIPLLVW